jgi:hypothetical protein
MTAFNINIEEFISVLIDLRNRGVQLMNLDMLPDESNPNMNKLIIHPNESSVSQDSLMEPSDEGPQDIIAKDPEDEDLFDLFNKVL